MTLVFDKRHCMILFSSDYRVITDHGKEARFPFLDEDVVSYLQSLPVHIKVFFL